MSEKEKSRDVIPKEITQLLERRATLGGWLARLDELSGTVRTEVYERVRSDYEERLRKQESDLTAHRSEMESALQERRSSVSALESDRDKRAAELEEAQLRFAVGEFAEAEFQKRKAAHDEKLAALDAELAADRSALEQLEDVVGVLTNLRAGASTSAPPTGTAWGTRPAVAEDAWPSEKKAEPAEDAWPSEKRAEPAEDAWPSERRAESSAPAASSSAAAAATVEEVGTEAAAVEEAEAATEVEVEPPATEQETREEPEASGRELGATEEREDAASPADEADYLDDLEFLESLSLDEIDNLDAVSAMLNEESDGEGRKEGSGSDA